MSVDSKSGKEPPFVLEGLSSFPENCNPYRHDIFNMGVGVGCNIEIMYGTHGNVESLIIVNKVTGMRCRILIN